MTDNPFKPPRAHVRDQPPRPGSALRAILTGLTVDIGGSLLSSVVLTILYAALLAASGMTEDQVSDAMKNIPPTSIVAILGTVIGACWSVAGGFVCARIVRRDEYRVGGVMGGLSALLGLMLGGADEPADMLVLLTLTTLACALLGVKYGRALNRRQDGQAR